MKLKQIILLVMIFSSIFSFGQNGNYEIINKHIKFYEFNAERTKIYMLDYDKKLLVYDVKTKKYTTIKTGIDGDDYFLKHPMFCVKSDALYVVGKKCVYKIKNDKFVAEIPFLYKEYKSGKTATEALATDKERLKYFNAKISDFDGESIISLLDGLYILNYKNGEQLALYSRILRSKKTEDKNRNKIKDFANIISPQVDTSYYRENIRRKGTVNYFENKKYVIKERVYSCRKKSIMSFVSSCRYKMKVVMNDENVRFKDSRGRQRALYNRLGKGKWNCNLFKYLPNSKYITDIDGNIYILFYFKNEQSLIKIPVKKEANG